MNGIACAHHPDRTAMGYCAGCGKALCSNCIARLPEGNYCNACASAPDHRPQPPARRTRAWVWTAVAALAVVLYVLARLL